MRIDIDCYVWQTEAEKMHIFMSQRFYLLTNKLDLAKRQGDLEEAAILERDLRECTLMLDAVVNARVQFKIDNPNYIPRTSKEYYAKFGLFA